MKISRVSDDDARFVAQEHSNNQINIQIGQYVSCLYDGKWWLGNILEINAEYEDVKVQFMHPPGPAASFHWPVREDVCWVPNAHILCRIQVPTTTRRGRQYKLEEKSREEIVKAFQDIEQS